MYKMTTEFYAPTNRGFSRKPYEVRGRDPLDAVARLALLALQAEAAAAVGAVALVAGCLAAHMAGLA